MHAQPENVHDYSGHLYDGKKTIGVFQAWRKNWGLVYISTKMSCHVRIKSNPCKCPRSNLEFKELITKSPKKLRKHSNLSRSIKHT